LSNIYVAYTVIRLNQIDQHIYDNSVYIVNPYTVSIDKPVIVSIFLICSLALCWKFPAVMQPRNLYNYIIFYHKIYCVPLFKSWGGHVPSVPP